MTTPPASESCEESMPTKTEQTKATPIPNTRSGHLRTHADDVIRLMSSQEFVAGLVSKISASNHSACSKLAKTCHCLCRTDTGAITPPTRLFSSCCEKSSGVGKVYVTNRRHSDQDCDLRCLDKPSLALDRQGTKSADEAIVKIVNDNYSIEPLAEGLAKERLKQTDVEAQSASLPSQSGPLKKSITETSAVHFTTPRGNARFKKIIVASPEILRPKRPVLLCARPKGQLLRCQPDAKYVMKVFRRHFRGCSESRSSSSVCSSKTASEARLHLCTAEELLREISRLAAERGTTTIPTLGASQIYSETNSTSSQRLYDAARTGHCNDGLTAKSSTDATANNTLTSSHEILAYVRPADGSTIGNAYPDVGDQPEETVPRLGLLYEVFDEATSCFDQSRTSSSSKHATTECEDKNTKSTKRTLSSETKTTALAEQSKESVKYLLDDKGEIVSNVSPYAFVLDNAKKSNKKWSFKIDSLGEWYSDKSTSRGSCQRTFNRGEQLTEANNSVKLLGLAVSHARGKIGYLEDLSVSGRRLKEDGDVTATCNCTDQVTCSGIQKRSANQLRRLSSNLHLPQHMPSKKRSHAQAAVCYRNASKKQVAKSLAANKFTISSSLLRCSERPHRQRKKVVWSSDEPSFSEEVGSNSSDSCLNIEPGIYGDISLAFTPMEEHEKIIRKKRLQMMQEKMILSKNILSHVKAKDMNGSRKLNEVQSQVTGSRQTKLRSKGAKKIGGLCVRNTVVGKRKKTEQHKPQMPQERQPINQSRRGSYQTSGMKSRRFRNKSPIDHPPHGSHSEHSYSDRSKLASEHSNRRSANDLVSLPYYREKEGRKSLIPQPRCSSQFFQSIKRSNASQSCHFRSRCPTYYQPRGSVSERSYSDQSKFTPEHGDHHSPNSVFNLPNGQRKKSRKSRIPQMRHHLTRSFQSNLRQNAPQSCRFQSQSQIYYSLSGSLPKRPFSGLSKYVSQRSDRHSLNVHSKLNQCEGKKCETRDPFGFSTKWEGCPARKRTCSTQTSSGDDKTKLSDELNVTGEVTQESFFHREPFIQPDVYVTESKSFHGKENQEFVTDHTMNMRKMANKKKIHEASKEYLEENNVETTATTKDSVFQNKSCIDSDVLKQRLEIQSPQKVEEASNSQLPLCLSSDFMGEMFPNISLSYVGLPISEKLASCEQYEIGGELKAVRQPESSAGTIGLTKTIKWLQPTLKQGCNVEKLNFASKTTSNLLQGKPNVTISGGKVKLMLRDKVELHIQLKVTDGEKHRTTEHEQSATLPEDKGTPLTELSGPRYLTPTEASWLRTKLTWKQLHKLRTATRRAPWYPVMTVKDRRLPKSKRRIPRAENTLIKISRQGSKPSCFTDKWHIGVSEIQSTSQTSIMYRNANCIPLAFFIRNNGAPPLSNGPNCTNWKATKAKKSVIDNLNRSTSSARCSSECPKDTESSSVQLESCVATSRYSSSSKSDRQSCSLESTKCNLWRKFPVKAASTCSRNGNLSFSPHEIAVLNRSYEQLVSALSLEQSSTTNSSCRTDNGCGARIEKKGSVFDHAKKLLSWVTGTVVKVNSSSSNTHLLHVTLPNDGRQS